MGRRHRKTQFFLALALVTLIPVVFAFFYYFSLSEADFISLELKLESPDQISLPIGSQDKFKAFGSSGFYHLHFLETNIFEQFPVISFQISPLGLPTFILRC
jgi:hypothetical protein